MQKETLRRTNRYLKNKFIEIKVVSPLQLFRPCSERLKQMNYAYA